jgi:hypothetical protein
MHSFPFTDPAEVLVSSAMSKCEGMDLLGNGSVLALGQAGTAPKRRCWQSTDTKALFKPEKKNNYIIIYND